MTNHELIKKLETLVLSERKITHQIIELIQLAEKRRLYLEQGYGSLFDWLTKHFHYSSSAAYRRMQAARLLSSLPAEENSLRAKIHSGTLNLTALAKVQGLVKEQEKRSGEKVSSVLKTEILGQIENQPLRTAEKILFQSFPEAARSLQQEKVSTLNEKEFRVSVTLSEEALSGLKRIQELLGYALPEASLSEVISYLSGEFLKRRDPLRRPPKARPATASMRKITTRGTRKNSAAVLRGDAKDPEQKRTLLIAKPLKSSGGRPASMRKPLSAPVKRFVFLRDQGRCQYKSPLSGKLCGSRKWIEIDHIRPLALGGEDAIENLRCLCRNHNQWRARETFSPRFSLSQ